MTHAASSSRRSREGWPDTEEPAAWAPAVHAHNLPSWLRRTVVAIGFVLLLFTVGLGALTYYVWLDHEYVMGRGQYRDAEAVRAREQTTEQIRAAICDLLDGLPAGPVLDPKRADYGCGPGIPAELLSPEAQEQLQQFSSGGIVPVQPVPQSVTKPPQPAVPPQEPPAASPPAVDTPEPAQQPPPGQPPVAPAAPTSPAVPPLIDLNPITDPLCNALGVCL